VLWPGDHRAGGLLTDQALLDAMVAVEQAWLGVLAEAGLAAGTQLPAVAPDDLDPTAIESTGNPVPALVAHLREASGETWVHRGLTSQDVLDTALVVCLRDAVARVRGDLDRAVLRLAGLARQHAATPMVARTLTQHAVPTTFGLKAATWLTGLLDARDDLDHLDRVGWPVQLGGAAGTLAAVVELGLDPRQARDDLATRLDLAPAAPWHTTRRPLTRVADALVAVTDAAGRLAADVATLSRPEIAELSEGHGGGSSTMPHKANPVLSVQVRRAALAAPGLAATLHLAAATQVDERADGAWHVEWATLRDLGRRGVVAASQTADLLDQLVVHPAAMAATLAAADDGVHAEQRAIRDLLGRDPSAATDHHDYLGAATDLVRAAVARAEEHS